MSRIYEKLLSLSVRHDFYISGVSTDLAFIPTAETLELLSGYRIHFKDRADGFSLITQMSGSTPSEALVPLGAGEELVFRFDVENLAFWQITSLPAKADSGQIYYSQNINGQDDFTIVPLTLRPPVFRYCFRPAHIRAQLRIITPDQQEVVPESPLEVDLTAFEFCHSLDLSAYGVGVYAFRQIHSTTGALLAQEDIYIDSSQYQDKPFGLLAIQRDDWSFTPGSEFSYEFSFSRRAVPRKYRVTVGQDANEYLPALTGLRIDDSEDYSGVPAGYPYSQVYFRETTGTLPGYAAGTVLEFESVSAEVSGEPKTIPYYEVPKRKLKLIASTVDPEIEKTLVADLPGPELNAASEYVQVYI